MVLSCFAATAEELAEFDRKWDEAVAAGDPEPWYLMDKPGRQEAIEKAFWDWLRECREADAGYRQECLDAEQEWIEQVKVWNARVAESDPDKVIVI